MTDSALFVSYVCTAFLFTFCYNVAEARDASISEVSLSMTPRDGQQDGNYDNALKEDNGEDSSAGSSRPQSSHLASITVSGLYLAVRILK